MKLFQPFVEAFKSLSKATMDYYSAWTTLGRSFKLKAQAELLEAVHKKMKIDEKYSQLTDSEVAQAKEVLDVLSNKLKEERLQIVLFLMPLIVFLLFMYALIEILLEVLRIIFN